MKNYRKFGDLDTYLAGLVQVEGLGGDLGQVVDGETHESDGLDGDLAVNILDELDKPGIWLLAGGVEGHHPGRLTPLLGVDWALGVACHALVASRRGCVLGQPLVSLGTGNDIYLRCRSCCRWRIHFTPRRRVFKKSRIRETNHLSTDADSSTDTTVG